MRRWWCLAAVIVGLSTGVNVSVADPAAPTTHPTIQILPLGDSITAGSDGGYRKPLAEALAAKHLGTIVTLGSQTDPSLPAGWQAHEGHPGWRIDQLTANLLGRRADDPAPRSGYYLNGGHDTGRDAIHPTFVTLMAGINDLNGMIGHDPSLPMSERSREILDTLKLRMGVMLTTLTDTLPDSTILVGGCTPYTNGLLDERLTGATPANRAKWASEDGVNPEQELGVNHWVLQFNQWLRDTYVPQLQQAGKKLVYVDVYAKFILPDGTVRGWNNDPPQRTQGPAAYGDYGLHPNLFGYTLMSQAWAAAIDEQLTKK